MKRILGLFCFLILLSGCIPAFAKESYDYSNPEFKSIVDMLNMEGHSNDSLATCQVKQLYYKEVANMYFNKGMSKQEILDYYVRQQGEAALNAPHANGFNISLWVTPFVLLFAMTIIIFFVIKKWKINRKLSLADQDISNKKDIDYDIYEAIIDGERKKIL